MEHSSRDKHVSCRGPHFRTSGHDIVLPGNRQACAVHLPASITFSGQRSDVKSSPQSDDSSDFLQALEPAESAESGLGQAPQACPTQPYIFVDDKKDYKDEPLFAFCDSCKNHVMTNVSYKIGKLTVVSVGALCLLGCAAGCCLVPFLWKRFRDVVHSCPNCQIKLGKYQRTPQNFC